MTDSILRCNYGMSPYCEQMIFTDDFISVLKHITSSLYLDWASGFLKTCNCNIKKSHIVAYWMISWQAY